jgi:phage shock protein A
MAIISRIKKIISANINGLLEKAEDPETLLKGMIREMDENIIKMRNEIVRAVATEKWLVRQIEQAEKRVATWQENSERAVQGGDDKLAREAIHRKLQEELKLAEIVVEQKKAAADSDALKSQLRLLEDKVQDARRKKELLVARKKRAMAHRGMLNAARDAADAARKGDMLLKETEVQAVMAGDSFADEVARVEAEAEAMREMAQEPPSLEAVFEESKTEEEVERRLRELKKKLGK